ncbi:MAG: hypothetical protein QOI25_1990 [Mycobacterium sp.]|nr:hypothetical protein [Mycobacterium sp.]
MKDLPQLISALGARARAYGGNIVILVDSLAADSVFIALPRPRSTSVQTGFPLKGNSFGVWKAADGCSAVEHIAMTPKRLISSVMSASTAYPLSCCVPK